MQKKKEAEMETGCTEWLMGIRVSQNWGVPFGGPYERFVICVSVGVCIGSSVR